MPETTPVPRYTFVSTLWLGVRNMWRRPLLASILLLATLVQGALQGLLIWALREVLVNLSGAGGKAVTSLVTGAAVILGLWILRSFTTYLAQVLSVRLAYRVEHDSMMRVLRRLLGLSVRFYDRHTQSDLVMASYQDLKGIRSATLDVARLALYASQIAGLVVAAWHLDAGLALIGLVAVPIGLLPTFWIGQRITRAAAGERSANVTLHDSFLQIANGIRSIKVNRGQERVLEQADHVGHDIVRNVVRVSESKALSRISLEAVAGFGLALILVLGGREVALGQTEWQSLLGLIVAVMAVYSPVIGILQLYGDIRSVIPNLERVDSILAAPTELTERGGTRALPRAPDAIELRRVNFSYGETPVLTSLSATFHRGEKIGIVGPSGSGKSTLISLLLRFYEPTSGSIFFDGVDLREIRHTDLMDLSAIVLQEPFLFAGTVAENIAIGRPMASRQEILDAARAANIHDEVEAMPAGYETMLGRGRAAQGISVGQKQRVAIAAALLKNPSLLFLDEATSSLDSVSELVVQDALERLMQGRTTFIVAHRLSTLRAADRILVLDQGQLVGMGPHDELLETCPPYRRLWESQLHSPVPERGREPPSDEIAENDVDSIVARTL